MAKSNFDLMVQNVASATNKIRQQVEQHRNETGISRIEDDSFIINDIFLRIPPLQITVEKRAFNHEWNTLRTVQSQKVKSGYATARVSLRVIFNLTDKDKTDLESLVRLVAGLKATPFCVVYSDYLEKTLGLPDTRTVSNQVTKTEIGICNFKPIMLALASMSFSTQGHIGKPGTIEGIFDFLYFNYLPYTNTIRFKSGPDCRASGQAWESPVWRAFYEPLMSKDWFSLQFPNPNPSTNYTKFFWNEFLSLPSANPLASQAVSDILQAIAKDAKGTAQSVINAGLQLRDPNNLEKKTEKPNGKLIALAYKEMVKNGLAPENKEILSLLQENPDALDSESEILSPLLSQINETNNDQIVASSFKQNFIAAMKLVEERKEAAYAAQKKNKTREREEVNKGGLGFDKLLDMDMSPSGSQGGKGNYNIYRRINAIAIAPEISSGAIATPCVIQQITVSYQNVLSTIPMIGYHYPTIQHIASMDAKISLLLNVRNTGASANFNNKSPVEAINEMYDSVETTALRFKRIPATLTNLMVQNDFLKLFGLEEFLTESITTETIPGQPGRSMISLQLSETGINSNTKINPEQLRQEYTGGSVAVYKKIWAVIKKYITDSYPSYTVWPTGISETDEKQKAMRAIVIDCVNAFNTFANMAYTAALNPINSGDASAYNGLQSLREDGTNFGFLPNIKILQNGLKKEFATRGGPGSIIEGASRKKYNDDQLRKNMSASDNPLEAKKEELRLLETQIAHSSSQGLLKRKKLLQKEIIAMQKEMIGNPDKQSTGALIGMVANLPGVLAGSILGWEKPLGVREYNTAMNGIFENIIQNPIFNSLPEFSFLKGALEESNMNLGLMAYTDFRQQLSGVANLFESSGKLSNAVLMKYDPDCYLYYPSLNGGNASALTDLVDPALIGQAQVHSMKIFNNTQGEIGRFFKNNYYKYLQDGLDNSTAKRPYTSLKEGIDERGKAGDIGTADNQDEYGLASPLYSSAGYKNALSQASITNQEQVSVDCVCDVKGQSFSHDFGSDNPKISSLCEITQPMDGQGFWDGTAAKQGTSNGGVSLSGSPVITPGDFIWPVVEKFIPTRWGDGYRQDHRGTGAYGAMDLPLFGNGERGSPIFAAAAGTVVCSGIGAGITGNWIRIQHKINGKLFCTDYCHLDSRSVQVKDKVEKGTPIGTMGQSGMANQSGNNIHLHFVVRSGSAWDNKAKPPTVLIKDVLQLRGGSAVAQKTIQRKTPTPEEKKAIDTGRNETLGRDVTSTMVSPLKEAIKDFNEELLSGQGQGLIRAYPAFKLYFIESNAGRRVRMGFDDFFSYSAVQSIRVVRNEKIAADLCEIYLTNVSGILSNRKFRHDEAKPDPLTGSKNTFAGEKARTADGKIVSEERTGGGKNAAIANPIASLLLQEGVNIHLRLGYSNDPELLDTVFNGSIQEIEFSESDDLIRILAQSYAVQMVQNIKGLEKPMTKGSSMPFGWDFWGLFDKASTGRILENMMASPELTHFGRWEPQGKRPGAFGTGVNPARGILVDRWTFQPQPADDNIFPPTNQASLGDLGDGLFFKQISYIIYRTTIWDIFQEMTLRHPNFIAAAVPYQDEAEQRMTMFFGLPNQLYFSKSPNQAEVRKDKAIIAVMEKILDAKSNAATFGLGNMSPGVRENVWSIGEFISSVMDGSKVVNTIIKKTVGSDVTLPSISEAAFGQGAKYNQMVSAVTKWIAQKRLESGRASGYVRPFRRYHLIVASKHIISNNIRANARDVANTIVVKYSKKVDIKNNEEGAKKIAQQASSAMDEESFTLKLDNGLPPEDIRTQMGQFINVSNEKLAKHYALSLLVRNMKEIYKGSIVIIGNPKIKPHDVVYMFDDYSDMIGAFEVGEVQHIMDQEHGFRTELKPNMLVSASEWSTLGSYEALGIVCEGMMNKVTGNSSITGSGTMLGLPHTKALAGGMYLFGGFVSQKILNFTQLAQPLVMAPLMKHGRAFAGGIPTQKLPASLFDTTYGTWSSSYLKGKADWWEDFENKLYDIANTVTLQHSVGKPGTPYGQ